LRNWPKGWLVKNKWVVNASPVILLAKVGQTTLLPELAAELIVPASVVAEVEAGPERDPARSWLQGEGAKWIRPDAATVPALAAWDLGHGEAAVLNWSFLHRDFEAILDDRAARKCAQVHGIPYRGTLGVILAAKARGVLPAARPVCEQVVQAGLLVDPKVLRDALALVGE
jgi:predicted nucleic acid-binding protein